jgi:hypothetical protein
MIQLSGTFRTIFCFETKVNNFLREDFRKTRTQDAQSAGPISGVGVQ